MERVVGLIKAKATITPSSLDLEIVDLGRDYHSLHTVIPAPLLTAGDQLSIDAGTGKVGMYRIENPFTLSGRVLAQGDETGDGSVHDCNVDT